MNPLTVGIGVLAILFGCYTFYLRTTSPEKFGKLEAMKEQWGESAGTTIHLVAYTVVPIIFGVVMVMRGMQGGALF